MIPLLSNEQCLKTLNDFRHPSQKDYFAFYSSVLGGITKNPTFMSLPIDDHIVHRGDGVFEALKVLNGKMYLWSPHFERLKVSAAGLGLKVPENLNEIVKATLEAGEEKNCIIRIYLSRGPGHFSANPYDSIGNQLYVVSTRLVPVPENKYETGVQLGRSLIAIKPTWLAQLKSCNYLPNVMMKKEAVDRKLDFTIGIDNEGFITEGSTENLVLLTKDLKLLRPKFKNILKGTTMNRALQLAEKLIPEGLIHHIGEADLVEADIQNAKEAFMIGTTLDVLPAISYEAQAIGDGKVGPVAKRLLQLLREDQL